MSAYRIKVRHIDRLRSASGPRLRSLVNDDCYCILAGRGILSPENQPAFDRLFDEFIEYLHPSTPRQLSRIGCLAVAEFSRRYLHALRQNTKFPNEPNPISEHPPDASLAPHSKFPNEPNPNFGHHPDDHV